MKKICFVCLGNICRSPMAEFVMREEASDASLEIASRATSGWEHGNPIHRGTQGIFRKYKITYDSSKRSQRISLADFAYFDWIIGMDETNVCDLKRLSQKDNLMIKSFFLLMVVYRILTIPETSKKLIIWSKRAVKLG